MGVTDNLVKYNNSGVTLPQLGGVPQFLRNQLSLIAKSINLLVGTVQQITPDPTTFADTPAPSAALQGLTRVITDPNVLTWGSAVTAGGGVSGPALVWCNGTNWTVIGK